MSLHFLEWPVTRHMARLSDLANPELVPADRMEEVGDDPDPTLAGLREVKLTSNNLLSRRLPPRSRRIPLQEVLASIARVDPEEVEEEVPLAERDFDPPALPDPHAWMHP